MFSDMYRVGVGGSQLRSHMIRDSETAVSIRFVLLRGGGGIGGREEDCPPKCCFSWEAP